jgi:hypothetical protein
VFYEEGLSGALAYYDANYDLFDEETKTAFANALKEELAKKCPSTVVKLPS